MKVDIHTHIFPDKIAANVIDKLSLAGRVAAFADGTLGGLSASMKEAGIDRSVILPVATHTGQVEKINDFAAGLNEKFFGKGIFSFGCIHPEYGNYRSELARIKNLGLNGIKVHPIYQGANIDDIKYLRIFARAAELDLVVVTHAGLDIGFPGVVHCSPAMSLRVVREVGDFAFVLAHMGGWRNWREVLSLLADTKVYIDTAFSFGSITPRNGCEWDKDELRLMDEKDFMEFFAAFGADRIIFGTDSPWTSQKESVAFIDNLPISDDDRKKILGLNAKKLCGF